MGVRRLSAVARGREQGPVLVALQEAIQTLPEPVLCGWIGLRRVLDVGADQDLEHRVQLEAEALGFQWAFPDIGPANVKGLEINPYAAELARVSVWIGEIQWMRRNGFYESRNPILKPLDTIECRDAILTPDSTEPDWPEADVIIGNPPFLGGNRLIVIARADDTTFGILHSRFHEVWSLRIGTSLEDRPRYTPTTTFETFPFPDGLTPNTSAADYADDPRAAAIADAAQRLVELRDRWLNPPEWVEWLDEPVPGYPQRPVPRDDAAVTALKTRTLTSLYNASPQWLVDAHAALDAAVATAYGWPADISDDDALAELLALNLANGH